MPSYQIRPVSPAEYPRLAEIANQTGVGPYTAEGFALRLKRLAERGSLVACLVLKTAGIVAAYGLIYSSPFRPQGAFSVGIKVDSAYAGQGFGSAMLQALERQARMWGATTLEAEVRDDRPAYHTFAERRGFSMHHHYLRSELNLATFDPAPFRPLVTQLEEQGYRFTSMAEVDPAEGPQRLYQLHMACVRDEPSIEGSQQPMTFAEYLRAVLDDPAYDPAGFILALKDEEWAAMSGCGFPPDRRTAPTTFTGVRRGHRGLGLAQAAKLLAIEHARQKGYTHIQTGNHAANAAILAINRKLGFTPLPGTFTMQKIL